MDSTKMYAEAEAILTSCRHDKRTCEIEISKGHTLMVCVDCWNRHVYARQAARKQQLVEFKATLPICDRCGRPGANWMLASYHLCARCKTATKREHEQSIAKAGSFAIFATSLLVDTSKWACRQNNR